MIETSTGREIALREGIVKNCNVCKLGYEMVATINNMIVNGTSYTEIFRTTSALYEEGSIKSKPSKESITNHAHKHIGHRSVALRKIIEFRARQKGLDIEKGEENILTEFSVLDSLIKVGYENLAKGDMKVEAKDLIAATKALNDMSRAADSTQSLAEAYNDVNMLLRAVKETVPEHMWIAIAERVAQLKAGEDVEDAYVIEDEVDE